MELLVSAVVSHAQPAAFAAVAAEWRLQTAKPFTLRILYNVRESGIVQLSIGRQRAAPAYRPKHSPV
ncbi:hypothetical protein B5F10_12600 [Anaerotruncus colihominis]|uniref:Uncharacterized protein n=1 Tax=Anaerotruncus colihominis TaxID=169435 RepID=A0A1Y4E983_9FIRM|nr:hypothetical protein B5F55_13145 [Anaerotruncus colihominis]OUP67866.1 hypothetical protein B5F11_16235 [Anaerotruncus colihominis]OUP73057.1 hypothetical protein B5F10_12600 [Anaerotruncus colihominis]RGE68247.1 hypothetical protein DXC40_07840 [Anaerotruncus colihominis]